MELTKGLIAILLTAILTQNFVLSKFLGICPFLGVSKKLNTAVGMSAAVIFVMALATAATYPINTFLLEKNGLGYLQTIVFILVIAALVQLVEIILKKYIPALYSALGIYLPLITTNCAVLGVVILNVDNGYGFAQSMFNSVGAGLGFMLAMVMFAGVRERMESCDIPKFMRGLPITLVAASLVSVSFLGFTGIVEHIFG
ncbi:MAG: RnfABCDGE type electron transport complex subunit A [Clostridia bacterium]|nr:RnfABCDGE type electron transport complex subunit A [Clostridia bacterium]MBR3094732.1 RnfABCDGE type electron transport complex subunit A [Clostridia bacterium]